MQSDFVGTQNGQYIFDFHSLSTTAFQVDRKITTELFCKNVKFCFFPIRMRSKKFIKKIQKFNLILQAIAFTFKKIFF